MTAQNNENQARDLLMWILVEDEHYKPEKPKAGVKSYCPVFKKLHDFNLWKYLEWTHEIR